VKNPEFSHLLPQMNEMERNSLDIALFAIGALGFLVTTAGVIMTTGWACVIGLLLMLLCVAYFAVTADY
jgi:hypothetical protein